MSVSSSSWGLVRPAVFDCGTPWTFLLNLGLKGYTLFFLCLLNIDCEYSLELEAVLTGTHNLYFEQKYEKYQIFYLKIFTFGGKIFNIFE